MVFTNYTPYTPPIKKKKKKKKKKKTLYIDFLYFFIFVYIIMSYSSLAKKDIKHQSVMGKSKHHYEMGRRTAPITDYYYGMGGSNPIPFRPLPGLIP